MFGRNGSEPWLLYVSPDAPRTTKLALALADRGLRLQRAASVDDVTDRLARERALPDYAIVEATDGTTAGLAAVRPLRAAAPRCRIVVLARPATIPGAVAAVKLGADDYLGSTAGVDSVLAALRSPAGIALDALPDSLSTLDRLEWEAIQRTLRQHGGNISATARALRLHRRTLQRKLARPPST